AREGIRAPVARRPRPARIARVTRPAGPARLAGPARAAGLTRPGSAAWRAGLARPAQPPGAGRAARAAHAGKPAARARKAAAHHAGGTAARSASGTQAAAEAARRLGDRQQAVGLAGPGSRSAPLASAALAHQPGVAQRQADPACEVRRQVRHLPGQPLVAPVADDEQPPAFAYAQREAPGGFGGESV